MMQRYEIPREQNGLRIMREYPNGDYVLYSDHLKELAHERQISDDVVKDNEILKGRIAELEALEETQRQKKEFYHEESARLTVEKADKDAYCIELQEKLERRAEHVVKLKEALQDLMDEQNGPPLIRNQASWEAAMSKAREALKEG